MNRGILAAHGDKTRRADLPPEMAHKIGVLSDELLAAGRIYNLSKRRKSVERILGQVVRIDPGNARVRLIAGGILCVSGAAPRGRALLADALRIDRGTIGGGETFSALMKLGRYRKAVACAERVLDGAPDLDDMRAFWNPWTWDARGSFEERRSELKKMARALGPDADSPWLHFYRGDLEDSDDLIDYERLARYSPKRYGWMLMKAGRSAFNVGRFDKGVEWLRIALTHKSVDWRGHAYLAEGLLCLGRPKDAYVEMDRALRDAPEREAKDVLAWRGALDLWLGRYEEALVHLEKACSLDASFAYCWRGGALVKLGRYAEAIEKLDETLRRFPQDFESYIWRGEAKRELGRYEEALEDLDVEPYAGSSDELSIWIWACANRALVKEALGDRAGFQSDFDSIPTFIIDYIRKKTGLADQKKILQAGLDLSRGFRREEYRQAIWMACK
jgi:tetratricopeptide (TPR) repeat protein